jgi:phosphatidylserine decarboxylase
MFHKEGGKIILIATTLTVVFLLLTDRFIDIFWLKKAVEVLIVIMLIVGIAIFQKSEKRSRHQ